MYGKIIKGIAGFYHCNEDGKPIGAPIGLIVSLNRMEKGLHSDGSALDEIKATYGFDAAAIVTMAEVTEYLYNTERQGKVWIDDELKKAIDEYYSLYGAK